MSCMTLHFNKQNLSKSPSLNDKMKVGAKLYNMPAGQRDICQVEKVMKVPIAQKSFNLEIWEKEANLEKI